MITPRGSEVGAVVGVLTAVDDEGQPLYDDETAMAKAIIKALWGELNRRDWYIMPWRFVGEEGTGVNYGPFATPSELRRYAGSLPAGGEHGSVLVLGPDRPRSEVELPSGCVCGHQPEQHVVRNVRGGGVSKPTECGVYAKGLRFPRDVDKKCDCTNFSPKGKTA